jgi:hypothetical protein
MKRSLLTIFIFIVPILLYGQVKIESSNQISNRQTSHSSGDVSVSLSPNILFNTPNGTQLAGGLKLRMFVGKRFSFDSDLMLGYDYAHFGFGLIGLPIWYVFIKEGLKPSENQTISGIIAVGVMMLISAEHTAYHIPVKNNTDLSPYISVLRLKKSFKPDNVGDQAAFAFGFEVNKYFNRFILSPYVEYNIGYSDHRPGFYTGVYCGYYFSLKK